jgi:hypothetical protein
MRMVKSAARNSAWATNVKGVDRAVAEDKVSLVDKAEEPKHPSNI